MQASSQIKLIEKPTNLLLQCASERQQKKIWNYRKVTAKEQKGKWPYQFGFCWDNWASRKTEKIWNEVPAPRNDDSQSGNFSLFCFMLCLSLSYQHHCPFFVVEFTFDHFTHNTHTKHKKGNIFNLKSTLLCLFVPFPVKCFDISPAYFLFAS